MDTFLSETKETYKWPYPKSIIFRVTQPDIVTKPKGYFPFQKVEPHCHCDFHKYEPQMMYYKRLKDEQENLIDKLITVNEKLAIVANYILDHPCDTDDDKMKSLYQIDFQKRGVNLPEYRKLIADIDSNSSNPIKLAKTEFLEGYRDPTAFVCPPIHRPVISSGPELSFKRTPESERAYFNPSTGDTEYKENVDKTARSIKNNMQLYREPLPTSRRRYGDPFL